jgi:hypothetical protein
MATADVSSQPLNVILDLFLDSSNQNILDNASYQPPLQVPVSSASLMALENSPLLTPNQQKQVSQLQKQLAPLELVLGTPLGMLFNTKYQENLPQLINIAVNTFTNQANAGGEAVFNVACSLPPSGSVLAATSPAQSATEPGSLWLSLHLPGCNFTFNGPHGFPTEFTAWIINFDADLVIATTVPEVPFNLAPTVSAVLSNASIHPNNASASFVEWADNFFTSVGNFFTDGLYVSKVSQGETAVVLETDQSFAVPQTFTQNILDALNALNNATSLCATLGFTQCAFSIVDGANGATLTLTVTHPLDEGPVLENIYDPPGGLVLNVASLWADLSQAMPGTPISVVGASFPLASGNEVSLEWPNTSSGTPTQSEISYSPGSVTTIVQTPSGFDNSYSHYSLSVNALTPGAVYSFQARCGDELTWSKWGPPLPVTTASTDLVTLTLNTPFGGGTIVATIGSAPLSATSDNWACSGQIPVTTKLGNSTLTATRAGQVIASCPITIVDKLTPTLSVVDPGTKFTVNPPIYGGLPFTLEGLGFPDGVVTIAIDGNTVATPVAQNGSFITSLKTPGGQLTVETVTLVASFGGGSVSLNPPIVLMGAPI